MMDIDLNLVPLRGDVGWSAEEPRIPLPTLISNSLSPVTSLVLSHTGILPPRPPFSLLAY